MTRLLLIGAVCAAALLTPPATASSEGPSKSCAAQWTLNTFRTIRYAVKTVGGPVSCSEARRVARLLFEAKGCRHNGGYGYNS
jgi:hypothetical protein